MSLSNIPLIRKLGDLIDSCIVAGPVDLLPICHTSTLEALRIMLETGTMNPIEHNSQFDDDLLFFFYGKARYIPEDELEDVFSRANPPVAFVFELEDIEATPKRLVAFDSGGYDRYNLDPPLPEFTLSLNTKSVEIKKYINQLYTKNENYLLRELTIQDENYPFCTPLAWLRTLYLGKLEMDRKGYGDQAYTIEIQYNNGIKLNPILIVLPARFGSCEAAIEQTRKAFNLDEEAYKKKVVTYNENSTIARNYYSIADVIDRHINDLMKPKGKTP